MTAYRIKILICEDEGPAQKHIVKLIRQVNKDAEIVAIVETGEEAIHEIENRHLDLIFMDIELADGPCFQTLQGTDINSPIIFTTAYDQYSLKAFELKSIDYLVKPISRADIEQAFAKFENMKRMFVKGTQVHFQNDLNEKKLQGHPDILEKLEAYLESNMHSQNIIQRLFIKTGETIEVVQTNDIQWIEASGNYIKIITEKKKYLLRSTLSGIYKKLDQDQFYQIHKSTILNISYVLKIEEMAYGDFNIILENGESLKMSRNYKDLIKSF